MFKSMKEFFKSLFTRAPQDDIEPRLIFAANIDSRARDHREKREIPALLNSAHFRDHIGLTIPGSIVIPRDDVLVQAAEKRLIHARNIKAMHTPFAEQAKSGDSDFMPGVLVGGAFALAMTSNESLGQPQPDAFAGLGGTYGGAGASAGWDSTALDTPTASDY